MKTFKEQLKYTQIIRAILYGRTDVHVEQP